MRFRSPKFFTGFDVADDWNITGGELWEAGVLLLLNQTPDWMR